MISQEPEEQEPVDVAIEPEVALSEARQKAEEYLENWKRAQADFINYKRHAEQEKLEMGQYANAQLIFSLLPILDDFERAFENISPRIAKSDWVEGVKLIESKFRAILSVHGLVAIEAVGKPFDPVLHEACMTCNGEEGIVILEIRRGYKLDDRVLRPSQVAVGNGEIELPDENKT